MWSEDGVQKKNDDDDDDNDDDSEEEDSEEEEDSDDGNPASAAALAAAAASREDRKKEKKARKEAAIARAKGQAVQVGDLPSSDEEESDEEDLPTNPNHSRAGRNQIKVVATPTAKADVDDAADGVKDLSLGGTAAPASRRERESLEAQQAKERYRKLHEQGKTDEAKADLARLKIIREKREAEAARKQVSPVTRFLPTFITEIPLLTHS